MAREVEGALEYVNRSVDYEEKILACGLGALWSMILIKVRGGLFKKFYLG